MKKSLLIIAIAAVPVIAVSAMLTYGLTWLFSGILFEFVCECTYYYSGDTVDECKEHLKISRRMIVIHTFWCVSTFVLIYILGVQNGFEYYTENPSKNFEQVLTHQNPYYEFLWWLLVLRVIGQVFIEAPIKDQINRLNKHKKIQPEE